LGTQPAANVALTHRSAQFSLIEVIADRVSMKRAYSLSEGAQLRQNWPQCNDLASPAPKPGPVRFCERRVG
jgi:hypothetical protein